MANEIIIRLNAMGDILLAIPTAHRLAQSGHKVHWVINERWKQLAPLLPAKVYLYDGAKSLLPLVKKLRKLKPTKVYDLQGKVASVLMTKLLGATSTLYTKRSYSEQLKALTGKYPLSSPIASPVWKRYAESAGIQLDIPNASLVLTDEYMTECLALLKAWQLEPKNFILLHPDASKEGKVMPSLLVSELAKSEHLPICLIGTGKKKYNANFHLDLRNEIDLYHLAGIMKLSNGVISTDSGPMHLARSVDTKISAIFFQTDPVLGFSPIPSENVQIISKQLPCKPCSLHGNRLTCPENTFACKEMDWTYVAKEIDLFMRSKI